MACRNTEEYEVDWEGMHRIHRQNNKSTHRHDIIIYIYIICICAIEYPYLFVCF